MQCIFLFTLNKYLRGVLAKLKSTTSISFSELKTYFCDEHINKSHGS